MDAVVNEKTLIPASVALGVRVEGIDLAGEHGDRHDDVIDHLRALLLEHHLLVLPGQDLSPTELESFGRQWGDLLTHPATKHRDTDFVQWIGSTGRKFKFVPGVHPVNGGWHSDMTWHSTPPIITGLHARCLPRQGGDTAFANQHLAYETLDDETKDQTRGAPGLPYRQGFRSRGRRLSAPGDPYP